MVKNNFKKMILVVATLFLISNHAIAFASNNPTQAEHHDSSDERLDDEALLNVESPSLLNKAKVIIDVWCEAHKDELQQYTLIGLASEYTQKILMTLGFKLSSTFTHEMGHALAYRYFTGIWPETLHVGFGGGHITGTQSLSPSAFGKIIVAASGPFAGLLFSVSANFLLSTYFGLDKKNVDHLQFESAACAAVDIENLSPAVPNSDGEKIYNLFYFGSSQNPTPQGYYLDAPSTDSRMNSISLAIEGLSYVPFILRISSEYWKQNYMSPGQFLICLVSPSSFISLTVLYMYSSIMPSTTIAVW